MMEMVFLETLLSFYRPIISDSLKDWCIYKISLRRALRMNKILQRRIFEINTMDEEELVTEKDKRIWIDQKRDQKEEYLKQYGER